MGLTMQRHRGRRYRHFYVTSKVKTITTTEIEVWVDQRLKKMATYPLMWGTPFALECECFLLIEIYERFGREGVPRNIGPAEELYQTFRQTMFPKCPGHITLTQWFEESGALLVSGWQSHGDELWVAVKIVEFFIAWKKYLVSSDTECNRE